MVAGVNDNPLGAEPAVDIDIAFEILVDGFGHKGRIFCDVHCRKSMKAEMDAVFFTCPADTRGTCIIEAGERVVGGVELDVDVADIVSRRPRDGLLQPKSAPDVDPDPVPQHHLVAPLKPGSKSVFPKSALQASSFSPTAVSARGGTSRP